MSKPINKTRMTTYIRDCMIEKAVQTSGIADRKHQLVQQRADFAENVRHALLKSAKTNDTEIGAMIGAVKQIVAGNEALQCFINAGINLSTGLAFEVNLNGMSIKLWRDGRREVEGAYQPAKTYLTDEAVKVEGRYIPRSRINLASPELADRFMQLEAAADKVKDDEANLRATLGAAIKRFGTVESMVAQWPESEELLPNELKPSTGLAISTTDLNAICGIPKGE